MGPLGRRELVRPDPRPRAYVAGNDYGNDSDNSDDEGVLSTGYDLGQKLWRACACGEELQVEGRGRSCQCASELGTMTIVITGSCQRLRQKERCIVTSHPKFAQCFSTLYLFI